MIDYHVHTRYCGHAEGEMEQYVEHAIELGLDELGFSGHYPYPDDFDFPVPDCVIPKELFGTYLSEAAGLRDKYAGRIKIKLGTEIDYLGPGCSFHPLEEALRLGLDFCMASVHIVDGIVVDYTPEVLRAGLENYEGGLDRLYERYYEAYAQLAVSGFCNIIGHLDLIKKLSSFEGLAPGRDHTPLIDRVLDIACESGTAIEINTAGWDKPCGEQYPALDIIKRAVARGVMITTGSDAHSPAEVGRHYQRLYSLIKKLGIKQLVRFEKLEPVPYDIG